MSTSNILCLFITEVKGKNERIQFTFRPDARIKVEGIPQLVKRYKCNILLKGGHLSEDVLTDVLATKNKEDVDIIKTQRIKGDNFHGTGCRLSSGIAGYIAQGYSILDSIKMSKESLERYYINTFGYKK